MIRGWRIWWRYLRGPRWEAALRYTGKSGAPGATHELHKEKAYGTDAAVVGLTEFMASWCFNFNNQSTTIRGYLSAIKYYHKMVGS